MITYLLQLRLYFYLQERAERLFMTKGKKLSDLNPNIFAKTKPGKEGRKDSDKMKDIAKQEAYIYRSD